MGVFGVIDLGEYVRLIGAWTTHKTFGKQFKVSRKLSPNRDKEGIKRYLASRLMKGIGEKTAQKIVDHFGDETLSILENEPERLSEVPSIGEKKKDNILECWNKNRHSRDTELFLFEYGLTPSQTAKIVNRYGSQTLAKVSQNPYRLASEIGGIGFLSADKIALKMGLAPNSKERVSAAILYQLSHAEENGHCFLSTEQMISSLTNTLNTNEEALAENMLPAVQDLNKRGDIVTRNELIDDKEITTHYLIDLLIAEENVAKKLVSLLKNESNNSIDTINKIMHSYMKNITVSLTETQQQAVKKASQNQVFILTGGPGVGKTTTVKAIIHLFDEIGRSFALAAPTGRASQRLKELTGFTSKTIHRLLEWNPEKGGFTKDETNPLTQDVVIIDEASMIDIHLLSALVSALKENAQLIIIGDMDQLPSVGAGSILRDMIESDVIPYSKLTEVFRQAQTSRIISTAHAINNGSLPEFSNEINSDCKFIEIENPSHIKNAIKELTHEILPKKTGYDPIKEIQILTPMNKGDLGTQNLNIELQEILNPRKKETHEYQHDKEVFRPGDKVIQSTNNYQLGIFNGDIGYVLETGLTNNQIVVSFESGNITYNREDAKQLKLAYSITIHKSQGSEFPVVIIPISMQHYIMLQRNLIYTALTRAKKLAIFIGTKKALDHAIRTQASLIRQTLLKKRLKDEFGGIKLEKTSLRFATTKKLNST